MPASQSPHVTERIFRFFIMNPFRLCPSRAEVVEHMKMYGRPLISCDEEDNALYDRRTELRKTQSDRNYS